MKWMAQFCGMRQTEKWMMAARMPQMGLARLHKRLAAGEELDDMLVAWRRRDISSWDVARRGVSRDWDALEELGGWAISLDDASYPRRLRELPDAPLVLFGLGDCDALTRRHLVAVVGTRDCSPYGRVMSRTTGMLLAEAGFSVVNGLAAGVDAAALSGCVQAGGGGVACLGHGLDRIHPKENAALAAEMTASGGALLTEYPVGVAIQKWHFAARNRIAVGMADTLVVIESPERGGSMISVDIALDMGVNLYVLEPPDSGVRWRGNQTLLDAFPSTRVDDPQDLLGKLASMSEKANWVSKRPPVLQGLSEALPQPLQAVWMHLMKSSGANRHACAMALGRSEQQLASDLLRLELMGWVIRSPGGVYVPVSP
jgi:DNA processing protein